ncbi:hypothetical protein MVI27_05055 [Chryseobacterium salipaludis]|uniref:hypothetical protein n=1 Tax=Chryseobacterium TaxID=59732 RepID=UPI001FF48C8B|nr:MULTISPECIES: hypothetical protein [Chryseobacterium]MCJ8497624.1 hypothetical protein [Chryseobacterium salipaludis]MCX3296033.1 hypothetical protein [Planobacterium sp. JC490]
MIAGTQNPIVGKDEFYQFTDARDIFNTANATFVWYIWKKQKSGKWINITGETPKMGQKVSYNFGQKVVGAEFKLQVYKATKKVLSQEFQAKLADEIVVVPSSSHVPKITKVVLFNRGAKDPNKASYRDTLVARAYCVAMFNQEVEFHLWEDDAPGGGHHSTINKNNQLPQAFKARVNEKGIAEVNISLLSNAAVLKAIANKYMMHGDKNEGANHEYYVTASYAGKIQKASQVNVDVANPDYKIKPKENSPKFPATSVSKTKTQADPKGEVTNAYFVNDKNEKLSRVAVGHHVKVLIKSKNLVGKYIQYVVWEQDIGWPDEIFRSGKIKIPGDLCVTGGFPITEKLFKKGIDSPFSDSDSKKQDYFLEIIVLDSTAESKKFGLDDKAGQPMEVVRSAAKVENIKEEKKSTSCICQEQYKDLVWGGKVSCEFRKKVVQICAELWGEGRKMEMANGLMAVIKVETWGSFKAHHREGYKSANDIPEDLTISSFHKESGTKSSRAVGLIQFTQDALEAMNEFPKSTPATKGTQPRYDALNRLKLGYAQMGEIRQLDKVKKYFEPAKAKIKTPEDIYLHVFAPEGVGKNDNYLLYAKGTDKYENNKSVDRNNDGIQRKEILKRYYDSKNQGEDYKASKFSCGIIFNNNNTETTGIVTFHIYYTGIIEKHIPKQIKVGYEKKYKYVFHDKENIEHEICVAEWHLTTRKLPSRKKVYSKPTHSKIISDKNVTEGQTRRRVIYENGDIAEYGSNNGDTFWRLYESTSAQNELVKMPDSVNYVSYSFSGTQRKYTGPSYFAGFLGALAVSGLTIKTTGSCFREGSCFPSQFHVNGESVDTIYFWSLEKDQKFIDAMKFFHFGERKAGNNQYFKKLKNVSDGGDLHDNHLHCGNFDESKIKFIKE